MAKNQCCPVFETAHLFGKKWMIVLLQEISLGGDKGFNHLHKHMGTISPKVISKLLKELESDGFVNRIVVEGTNPKRTSYALTKKGEEFHQIAIEFRTWQTKYDPSIKGCPERECVMCLKYQ